ncbi:hypothetical protein [Yoonia vestfoldensis]|uniref:hypothetical protein n=1 Tax=Yoonia vestfoldensis TaxID=245188 RepID=UPI0003606950|nr:hypothetical protein [Yoonia vestfoldensis]
MTDKTQILDVTYGTFSCRLEGFDDSVETMKLVVGYFHELAGHDRFLNTALIAPDMDTLARLTGDQSDGDVDAEMDDGKLSLRLRETADTTNERRTPLRLTPEPAAEAETYDDDADEVEDIADPDIADIAADEDDERPLYAESVSAKLDRIRAVVGRGHVPETTDNYSEDLTEEDAIAPRSGVNPLAQRLAELAKRNSDLAAIEAGIAPAPLSAAEPDETENWDEADFEDEQDLADLAALDGEEAEDLVAPTDLESDDDMTDAVAEAAAEAEAEAEADETPMVLTNPETALLDADDYEDEDDEDLHLANLVADDDLDLHEEVAEVEREIEDRNRRHELSRTADAAVSRILSHTDAELNQPERRRQQDAFAQLKAAVAATEAARQLGDDGGPKRRPSEVYRHDLGEFEAEDDIEDVRADQDETDDIAEIDEPSAPDAAAQDTRADTTPPASARPAATLRLVASQRADEPAQAVDPASQRLRQIAAKVDTAGARVVGFAEFADDHAATDLEDMIEAGAAYITFLLAEDDFSRPQVMKLVQTLTEDEISREDGLRCFGRLLRQNRIIKLDNGRFQVAPGTRFRPDDLTARG